MSDNSRKQIGLVAVSLIFLAAAAAFTLRPDAGKLAPRGNYYYDLGAKEIYVYRAGVTPPSGGEGVPAAVFACTSCDDPTDRFVAYLTRESDEYKKLLQSGEPPTPQQMENGRLIRTVDSAEWLPASSQAAIALMRSAPNRCENGKSAIVCSP